jgi:hypothetical protein
MLVARSGDVPTLKDKDTEEGEEETTFPSEFVPLVVAASVTDAAVTSAAAVV